MRRFEAGSCAGAMLGAGSIESLHRIEIRRTLRWYHTLDIYCAPPSCVGGRMLYTLDDVSRRRFNQGEHALAIL
jgi:hypothetical protein